MKLGAPQPPSLKAVPEQDGVHLPGELIDPPDADILNHLAGRIERQAVELAQRVDFIPVLADVAIFQSDVVGPVGPPARPAAARVESLPLPQEFGDAGDRLADPAPSSEDSLLTPKL